MELQINDLVSAIKKDGIETAQKEADAIVSAAKKQAESMIAEAKNEAQRIKENSEKEIQIFEESARVNAQQAKRDAVLAFKTEIQAETRKILSADVKKALDDKTLAKLILAAVAEEDVSAYAVELQDATDGLKKELADKIKEGLEIRISKNASAGFKLSAKDGSGYFDYSDEEITEMLMPFFRDIRL